MRHSEPPSESNGHLSCIFLITWSSTPPGTRELSFAGSITQKLPFYLFTREQDYYNAGGPEGSAGVFNPNTLTLMAVADLRSDLHTWNTVQHEGFHQFAHAYISDNLPIWSSEGLAEYFGEDVEPGWQCGNCDACDGGLVVRRRELSPEMEQATAR